MPAENKVSGLFKALPKRDQSIFNPLTEEGLRFIHAAQLEHKLAHALSLNEEEIAFLENMRSHMPRSLLTTLRRTHHQGAQHPF